MRRVRTIAVAAVLVAAAATAATLQAGAPPTSAAAASSSSTGEVFAFGGAPTMTGTVPDKTTAATANATNDGLLIATTNGQVAAIGNAMTRGGVDDRPLAAPVAAIERTPTDRGYWLVARDGGVFTFGDAPFLGSTGGIRLNQPIVAAASTPTGRGYWLVARDGGVFTFGDAPFLGSTGDIRLNQPIVAVVPTPTGRGYWLVARDGGVFTFGDAPFLGSTGGIRLNEPIVAAASTPTGRGYWLAARDGGVFTFGDATFHGSAAGRLQPGNAAVAIEPTGPGPTRAGGYWLVAAPGGARIAIAGDVHGERQIGDLVRRGGHPLGGVASVVAAADIAAVNLETPAGTAGTAQAKQYVFLAPPELLTALRAGGVDVITLANNHALDHGPATMLDTIERARAASLAVVGAGRNVDEAFAPAYVDAGHARRVAFIGLSRVVPPGWAATASRPGVATAYDTRRALDAVRRAKATADHVVVLVHWGVELARCPDQSIVRLADALHAAGADVVAGHHPHVLQGIDARPDRTTAYSLGNFVWYHNESPSDVTGVLDVTLDDGTVDTRFHPATIGANGQPSLLAGDAADRVRTAVMGSACWH